MKNAIQILTLLGAVLVTAADVLTKVQILSDRYIKSKNEEGLDCKKAIEDSITSSNTVAKDSNKQ